MRGIIGLLCLCLAGCATASIEDAVPAGALAEPVAAQAQAAASPAAGQAAAGPAYPNLNAEPTAAAPQITEEQRASETAALRARRDQIAGRGQGAVGSSEADLRRLAQRHGEDVLKEIENE